VLDGITGIVDKRVSKIVVAMDATPGCGLRIVRYKKLLVKQKVGQFAVHIKQNGYLAVRETYSRLRNLRGGGNSATTARWLRQVRF
jgi:hypothetical protein